MVSRLVLGCLSVLVCLVLVEAAFRPGPWFLPSGAYGAGERHAELGMNTHGREMIYNKIRYVVRTPNAEGFLDATHERRKPDGVRRVGFFGDSYVESAQVEESDVFFRRLGAQLAPGVETLGFGMSGWGTFHAFRAFQVFAPKYDLDVAVYVFVENDLGDQLYELARHRGAGSAYPFAELTDDVPEGFRERWVVEPGTEPFFQGFAKFLQRHSLLAHVVQQRLFLLRDQGLQVRADPMAREMGRAAEGVPDSNDLASTWPKEWADPARELAERVLRAWAREAENQGVALTILYVPRGEDHLRGKIASEDTWKPWLEQTCARLAIPLIDPTGALASEVDSGQSVYDDHWTPAGHQVVARVLAEHELLRGEATSAGP